MGKMNTIDWLAYVLLVVGGLVHGGQAFGYYAVEELLGFIPYLPEIVYGLVGLSGLYAFWTAIKLSMK